MQGSLLARLLPGRISQHRIKPTSYRCQEASYHSKWLPTCIATLSHAGWPMMAKQHLNGVCTQVLRIVSAGRAAAAGGSAAG
jgi:hypothetical protein